MQVQQTYNTLASETLLENDVESRRKTQLKVATKGVEQIFCKSKRFCCPVHKSLTNGEKRVAFFFTGSPRTATLEIVLIKATGVRSRETNKPQTVRQEKKH